VLISGRDSPDLIRKLEPSRLLAKNCLRQQSVSYSPVGVYKSWKLDDFGGAEFEPFWESLGPLKAVSIDLTRFKKEHLDV
jgi:hypothetical protein